MAQEVRIPPHSDEAEKSVLGSLLIDKDAIISVIEFLRPEHFYQEAHAKIYKAIVSLYEERQPVDIITLTERLKKQRSFKAVGGADYLTSLVNIVPTSAHAVHYAQIVKDLYTKRQLIACGSRLVKMAFDEGVEAAKALDQAEQAIFSLSQRHLPRTFIPVKDALAESFDRLDELQKNKGGLRGVPTGFKDLDDTFCLLYTSPSPRD